MCVLDREEGGIEMIRLIGFPVCIILFVLCGRAFASSPGYEAVSGFDLNRYLGKWYEIARLPNRFEKGLVNVTATYSLRDNGMVKVLNEGCKGTKDGKHASVTGKAKFAAGSDKGHLRVSFFWFFYADYVIFALDPDYKWALVGSSDKYLWILSREPRMEKDLLDNLVGKAKEAGFDTDRLYFTPQDW